MKKIDRKIKINLRWISKYEAKQESHPRLKAFVLEAKYLQNLMFCGTFT